MKTKIKFNLENKYYPYRVYAKRFIFWQFIESFEDLEKAKDFASFISKPSKDIIFDNGVEIK